MGRAHSHGSFKTKRPLQGARQYDNLAEDERRDHERVCAKAVSACRNASCNAHAHRRGDRTGDLPRGVLPDQVETDTAHCTDTHTGARREGPRQHRRAPSFARGWEEDGEPRGDPRIRQAGDLCGHPRAPNLEQARIRAYEDAGEDGVRAAREASFSLLDRVQ
jgi:hypothetical protein